MHHTVAITQVMQHVRHMFILRTREDIHLDADLSQVAGQFPDVNIHPACIFSP